jgi:hypothetical protein
MVPVRRGVHSSLGAWQLCGKLKRASQDSIAVWSQQMPAVCHHVGIHLAACRTLRLAPPAARRTTSQRIDVRGGPRI